MALLLMYAPINPNSRMYDSQHGDAVGGQLVDYERPIAPSVPEPMTISLIGAGLVDLGLTRFRAG